MGNKAASGASEYECVVVGAGLGGLCAAFELARNGVRVLLLERHNLPGGFATSFVRGRFEFEPSLHELPDMRSLSEATGVVRYLLDDAGLGVRFLPVPEAYRVILSEPGLDVSVPFGVSACVDAIERAVPGSASSVSAYFELCAEVQAAFRDLNGNDGKPDYLRVLRERGNFVRTASATASEVAEALGVPERAHDILFAYWCYLGVPAESLSFPIWASLLHSYVSSGAVIPAMRSHEIACAFEKGIREAGGEIRYNTPVEAILAEGGAVVGVRTAYGETIRARGVVSNASPTLAFNTLVSPRSQVPARATMTSNARRLGFSVVVVYLGLDADMATLGLKEYSYFIAPHMRTRELYDGLYDLESDDVMQASVCLNAANPGCSPPGTTILSITAGTRPEAWADVAPEEYHRVKARVAERLIAQFEAATGVDLRSHIEELEVATPETFARYTGAWNGVVYGYEPEPWDSVIPRALAVDKERFLDGLDFCGGFSYRCHGYGSSILSGKAAAERVLGRMAGGGR
ncbi:MAG: NAD(P)/FAD-dependent oxidoreductase [Spirochaetes bacterium]|nr:NAD(P)/FAD-dependent oxidoreductase [Spirochaetota bacterium]MBU1081043.1 NAD(P)/FAD-dependent oxidoreductase [Spirochaetota bacterium]